MTSQLPHFHANKREVDGLKNSATLMLQMLQNPGRRVAPPRLVKS